MIIMMGLLLFVFIFPIVFLFANSRTEFACSPVIVNIYIV